MSFKQTNLGGGMAGRQPALIGGSANSYSGTGMVGGSERSLHRSVMRKAFGNQYNLGLGQSPILLSGAKTTPFRLAYSAGDPNGTVNEAANRKYGTVSNQINGQTRMTALGGIKSWGDGIKDNGSSAYAGNPKKVYDSSDYIRYRKLRAENKNYNDSSFGGNEHHANQSILRRAFVN